MKLSGPIGPVPREVTEDFRNRVVPMCWTERRDLENGWPALVQRAGWGSANSRLEPLSLVDSAAPRLSHEFDGSAFYCVTKGAPQVLLREMSAAAESGARVYVLGHEAFGEGAERDRLKDGRILVRRVQSPPASAVVTGRGATSSIFLGASASEPARWCLHLEPNQGAALFRSLLRLFWHEAIDEGYSDGKTFSFKVARDRPFDVPAPSHGDPVRLYSVASRPDLVGDLLHLNQDATEYDATWVLVPPGSKQDAARQAAADGGRVGWAELGLPDFAATSDAARMNVESDKWGLAVDLDETGAEALSRLTEDALDAARWRVNVETELGELSGAVWLPGTKAAEPPVDCEPIDCGAVQADELRSLPVVEPDERPKASPLALSAMWTWTVKPPRVPSGAKQDDLHKKWADFDASFASKIDAALAALAETGEHEGLLARTFKSLIAELSGFGKGRQETAGKLERLKREAPSTKGPGGARKLAAELEALAGKAGDLQRGVEKAGKKAEREREEAEQRAEHARLKKDAERELGPVEEQLHEATKAREAAEAAMAAVVDGAANRKEKKAKQSKLKSDLERAKAKLRKLQSKKAQLEKQRDAKFVFKPKASPSMPDRKKTKKGSFIPESKTSLAETVPTEAPPSTGTLFRHGTQRYLAISRWEDLDEGEREAKRFGARLVAAAEDK